MIRQSIPWLTSLFTLLGIWLLGRKNSLGWWVGIANQGLWIATAILFRTWGLLPLTAGLLVIYTRNLILWRRDERTLLDAATPSD